MKKFIKVVCFLAIISVCLVGVNNIVLMKTRSHYNLKYVYEDYYDLDDDTVDVLLLGTSCVYFGISSGELYYTNGISAASLATPAQPMMLTYYNLLDGCRNQDIKLVVLDPSYVFSNGGGTIYKQQIDNMGWSSVKIDAIKTYMKKNSSYTWVDYLMPFTQYHSRWKELEGTDLDLANNTKNCFRGNSLHQVHVEYAREDIAFTGDEVDTGERTASGEGLEYFLKICDYCKDNNIQLLITKTPKSDWTYQQHCEIQDYADKYGFNFIDFNLPEYFDAIDYDTTVDMYDDQHPSGTGAIKITDYLSNYIKENYDLPDRRKENLISDEEMQTFLKQKEKALKNRKATPWVDDAE